MPNLTQREYSELVQIYESFNIIIGQLASEKPLNRGQRESLRVSINLFYRLLKEVWRRRCLLGAECAVSAPLEEDGEWNQDG